MTKYSYKLTTDEDQVLLDMIQYFNDLGLPDHIDPKAFESLSDKFFSNIQEIFMTITRSDCRYYIKEYASSDIKKSIDDREASNIFIDINNTGGKY